MNEYEFAEDAVDKQWQDNGISNFVMSSKIETLKLRQQGVIMPVEIKNLKSPLRGKLRPKSAPSSRKANEHTDFDSTSAEQAIRMFQESLKWDEGSELIRGQSASSPVLKVKANKKIPGPLANKLNSSKEGKHVLMSNLARMTTNFEKLTKKPKKSANVLEKSHDALAYKNLKSYKVDTQLLEPQYFDTGIAGSSFRLKEHSLKVKQEKDCRERGVLNEAIRLVQRVFNELAQANNACTKISNEISYKIHFSANIVNSIPDKEFWNLAYQLVNDYELSMEFVDPKREFEGLNESELIFMNSGVVRRLHSTIIEEVRKDSSGSMIVEKNIPLVKFREIVLPNLISQSKKINNDVIIVNESASIDNAKSAVVLDEASVAPADSYLSSSFSFFSTKSRMEDSKISAIVPLKAIENEESEVKESKKLFSSHSMQCTYIIENCARKVEKIESQWAAIHARGWNIRNTV